MKTLNPVQPAKIRSHILADEVFWRTDELREYGFTTFCLPLTPEFRFLSIEDSASKSDHDRSTMYFEEEDRALTITTRVYLYKANIGFVHAPGSVSFLGSFIYEGQRLFVYGPQDHTALGALPGR